jgi:hypothetical protein
MVYDVCKPGKEGKGSKMNYRELLRKYIGHIKECEGITFLEYDDYREDGNKLTVEDFTELKNIARETGMKFDD